MWSHRQISKAIWKVSFPDSHKFGFPEISGRVSHRVRLRQDIVVPMECVSDYDIIFRFLAITSCGFGCSKLPNRVRSTWTRSWTSTNTSSGFTLSYTAMIHWLGLSPSGSVLEYSTENITEVNVNFDYHLASEHWGASHRSFPRERTFIIASEIASILMMRSSSRQPFMLRKNSQSIQSEYRQAYVSGSATKIQISWPGLTICWERVGSFFTFTFCVSEVMALIPFSFLF